MWNDPHVCQTPTVLLQTSLAAEGGESKPCWIQEMNKSEVLQDESHDLDQALGLLEDLELRLGLTDLDPGLLQHLEGLLLPDLPEQECFVKQQLIFEPWVQMALSIAYVVVAGIRYNTRETANNKDHPS